MITQLTTVKARLGLAPDFTTHDALLDTAIDAVGALFAQRCQRTLERTVGAKYEFPADRIEIPLLCYPVESVGLFELKSTEAEGWAEVPAPEYLVREGCVLALSSRLGLPQQLARVTYTGGYVSPGAALQPGQTPFPADLEQAAVEHVAVWFMHREKAGLIRNWPSGGVYQQFLETPLLPSVEAVLKRYERWVNV